MSFRDSRLRVGPDLENSGSGLRAPRNDQNHLQIQRFGSNIPTCPVHENICRRVCRDADGSAIRNLPVS